jgi:hypothetical protein
MQQHIRLLGCLPIDSSMRVIILFEKDFHLSKMD